MPEGQTNRPGGVSKRGFASMDPERQREIARKGGEASHGSRKTPDTEDKM